MKQLGTIPLYSVNRGKTAPEHLYTAGGKVVNSGQLAKLYSMSVWLVFGLLRSGRGVFDVSFLGSLEFQWVQIGHKAL